jgi:hypothetical protein
MKRQLFALLGAVLALPAVAGGTAQKAAPAPPPYSGDYQPVGVDEIGLWREMDEDERALANSPMVIRDEALNKYIRGLLCATVGDDRCKSVRLYIVRTPVMNASMTPNGTMRVFSGLFLRTRSCGIRLLPFEQRDQAQTFSLGPPFCLRCRTVPQQDQTSIICSSPSTDGCTVFNVIKSGPQTYVDWGI